MVRIRVKPPEQPPNRESKFEAVPRFHRRPARRGSRRSDLRFPLSDLRCRIRPISDFLSCRMESQSQSLRSDPEDVVPPIHVDDLSRDPARHRADEEQPRVADFLNIHSLSEWCFLRM